MAGAVSHGSTRAGVCWVIRSHGLERVGQQPRVPKPLCSQHCALLAQGPPPFTAEAQGCCSQEHSEEAVTQNSHPGLSTAEPTITPSLAELSPGAEVSCLLPGDEVRGGASSSWRFPVRTCGAGVKADGGRAQERELGARSSRAWPSGEGRPQSPGMTSGAGTLLP